MSNKIYSLEKKSWVENNDGNEFYEDDLLENPSVRIPVMFCIDTGKEMFSQMEDGQTKLEKVQSTVKAIIGNFSSEGLKNCVDFSVVTFSDDVSCDKYFSCTGEHPYEVDLKRKAYSSIGSGIKLAADLLKERIDDYREAGIEYKPPFLFVFFGSQADSDDPSIDNAAELVAALYEEEGLHVFPINIGDADMETLGRFATEETFEKYGNVDFENFYNLVSSSVSSISNNEAIDSEEEISEDENSGTYEEPSISSSFEEINNL
jgi:uncharacterized protein YegL